MLPVGEGFKLVVSEAEVFESFVLNSFIVTQYNFGINMKFRNSNKLHGQFYR